MAEIRDPQRGPSGREARQREAYQAEFGEFVRAVREDRTPSPGFADGRAALVLAEAAMHSVATGRAVTVARGAGAAQDARNGAVT